MPSHSFSIALLKKARGEKNLKKLLGEDKDREIKYPVASQEKLTQLGEDSCKLLTLKNKIRW